MLITLLTTTITNNDLSQGLHIILMHTNFKIKKNEKNYFNSSSSICIWIC